MTEQVPAMTNSEECTTSHTSSDRNLDQPEQRRKRAPTRRLQATKTGSHRARTSSEKEEGSTVQALAMTNSATVTTGHTSNTAAVIHQRESREANQPCYNRRKGFIISTRTVRWLIVTKSVEDPSDTRL